MNEAESRRLALEALSDQAVAILHEHHQELKAMADRDPGTWTGREHQLSRAVVNTVLGLMAQHKL
mgnify:FL=1